MALAFAEKIHQGGETDLAGKKISELRETAVQLGCSITEMDDAMDADSSKSEFIRIIVEKAKTVVEEAEAEQARQLELAAEEKAALLRLKWSELKKAAKDCGVTEQESQGIEDAENPNEALAC